METVLSYSFLLFAFLFLLWLCLFRPQYLRDIFWLSIPLSFNISWGNVAISFPSELLLCVLAGMLLISFFFSKETLIKPNFQPLHPLTFLLLLDVLWSFLTTFTAEYPLIALKRSIIKMLYFLVFYLYHSQIFEKEPKLILRFFKLYFLGLLPVLFYTLIRHAPYSFSQTAASDRCYPFYAEHAVYGTCLVFLVPYLLHLLGKFSTWKESLLATTLKISNLLLLCFACFANNSRASWIGLMLALCMGFLLKLGVKFKTWMLGLGIFFLIVWINQDAILLKLQENKAESRTETLENQLASVTNISTDVSNLERINRWWCAFEMIEQRPFWGWGSGNFEPCYAHFQRWHKITRISTRNGEKGNAHSEILMALVEGGILGGIIWLSIMLVSFYCGTKIYFEHPQTQACEWALFLLLGLMTYYVHSFFNAFLNQDEFAALLITSLAALKSLQYLTDKTPCKQTFFS
ncbi:MAG: O-antigen ligase family protein [Bacteroidia bacterium]